MFRLAISVARFATGPLQAGKLIQCLRPPINPPLLAQRNFTLLTQNKISSPILNHITYAKPDTNHIDTRNVIKFSMRRGTRKTVRTVLKRFYRLNWGIWIRTIAGRHKRLWKKSAKRKRRLRQHVFCNATQSYMLDKMVGPFWRKPKYFVNDYYEPYHTREEFHLTYKKPKPYFPPEDLNLKN